MPPISRSLCLICFSLCTALVHAQAPSDNSTSSTQVQDSSTTIINHLKQMHGMAGPWTVLGYRAGDVAMKQLGAQPYTRTLRIVHKAPAMPQYSCMIDGVAVATGNSVGQLNLRLQEVPTTQSLETIAWHKNDDATSAVRVRLRPEIMATFADLSMDPQEVDWANFNIQKKTDDQLFIIDWVDKPVEPKPASKP